MKEALQAIIAKLEEIGIQLERMEHRQEEHLADHERGDFRPLVPNGAGRRPAENRRA